MNIKFNAGDSVEIPKGCKATIKDNVVIFEKEFTDGDILHSIYNEEMVIFKNYVGIEYFVAHFTSIENTIGSFRIDAFRHATEEEKQQLFDKMGEKCLCWNAEKKCVEKIRWRAEYRCRYFYIDSCLEVISSADFRYAEDEERWEVGNYFQTEEEAEEAAKILRGDLGKFHKENE